MDRIDRKILDAVSRDGRISMSALADTVGLTKTPCTQRLKRLERDGYIRGYAARLDMEKLGRSHVAFVQVSLTDTKRPALAAFNAAARDVPEIEACHMIAGAFDYLLKVRSTDIGEYRRVLADTISALPYVSHTSTFVALETVKDGGL